MKCSLISQYYCVLYRYIAQSLYMFLWDIKQQPKRIPSFNIFSNLVFFYFLLLFPLCYFGRQFCMSLQLRQCYHTAWLLAVWLKLSWTADPLWWMYWEKALSLKTSAGTDRGGSMPGNSTAELHANPIWQILECSLKQRHQKERMETNAWKYMHVSTSTPLI